MGRGHQNHPQEKQIGEGKGVARGGLKTAEKIREVKGKEKGKDIPNGMQRSGE